MPSRTGKPQYHPRLMLALLIYAYGNDIFSSRRIERATYRDALRCGQPPSRPRHDCGVPPIEQGGDDPQALPEEPTRREALKATLDAACARLEAEARVDAEPAQPA